MLSSRSNESASLCKLRKPHFLTVLLCFWKCTAKGCSRDGCGALQVHYLGADGIEEVCWGSTWRGMMFDWCGESFHVLEDFPLCFSYTTITRETFPALERILRQFNNQNVFGSLPGSRDTLSSCQIQATGRKPTPEAMAANIRRQHYLLNTLQVTTSNQ